MPLHMQSMRETGMALREWRWARMRLIGQDVLCASAIPRDTLLTVGLA